MKYILAVLMLTSIVSCSSYRPFQATSNPIGPKKGGACSAYFIGFRTKGANTIHSAAKAGNIKKVATVDIRRSGFFPIYWKECTYVSGS